MGKEEVLDIEDAENGSIHRLEACRVMRQRFRLKGIMKGGAFGFSGDCHYLGFTGSSGLPFRHSRVYAQKRFDAQA
jgi:hypothetical protein